MSKNQKLTGWLDKRFEFKVGDKHPFYKPVLIVKAVDKKTGFVKFKGLRGWRHPQHPYLMLAPKTKIKEQFK